MLSLIIDALADEKVHAQAGEAVKANGLMSMLPFVLIFVIFYFLLIRPQVKKQKEHAALLESIKRGEKVVTAGGIIGTVSKIEDDIIHLEIATDVKVKVVKSTITEIMGRNKSADTKDKDEAKTSHHSKD